jgi:hypothetical protein
VEERESELLRGKNPNEIKGERGAHGGVGHKGRVGRARLGRAGMGRGPGRKPTTHTTTNRKPIVNRNMKRGEMDARLNTIIRQRKNAST